MRTTGIALATTLVLSACGGSANTAPTSTTEVTPATTTPPSSTSTPASPTTTSTQGTSVGDLEVIMPPDASGEFAPDLLVACPKGGPTFPISALEEIPFLSEADPGGVAEAISPFLEGEEGAFWPQEDWRILHQSDDEVLLVHKGDTLSFMEVARENDEWRWDGSQTGASCPLQFTVPEHLNTVEWRLAPEAAELTPSSTEIPMLLTELECVSGQEIGDRLVGPQIVMTESQVFVAFAAQRPSGEFFECQGNPDMAYTVELPEPVGDREIVEGLNLGISLEDYLD